MEEGPNGSPETEDNTLLPAEAKYRNWYDKPHRELVADIRRAAAQARKDSATKGRPFDPIRWVGELLTRRALNSSGDAHRERMDASFAWDAISRPYIQDKDFQQAIDATLLTGTAMRQGNLVTLNPPASKLIHAMADAVGVPFAPEQRTVDLLPTQERKQLFRQVYTHIARKAGI